MGRNNCSYNCLGRIGTGGVLWVLKGLRVVKNIIKLTVLQLERMVGWSSPFPRP